MAKTLILYISCLVILIAVTFGSFFWLPAPIRYQITERYTLNAGNETSRVNLGIMMPTNGPYQAVEDENISWDGDIERKRHSFVNIYHLNGNIEAGETQEVILNYKITIKHGLVLWQNPVEEIDLVRQDLIESDHPDIKQAASKIADGKTIVDAYRIFDFTSKYLTRPENTTTPPERKSALYAYYSRTGTCGEYARLMVAFCRASGIPSRQISGILLPDLTYPGKSVSLSGFYPAKAHAWVEFHVPIGWSLADPGCSLCNWKIFQFARNDGRHISYGEASLEGLLYNEMWLWALRNGTLLDSQFAAFKYVLSAESVEVSMTPSVTIKNVWDGRWLNTLIITAITTILLRYFLQKSLR